jgi:hypothetical protein
LTRGRILVGIGGLLALFLTVGLLVARRQFDDLASAVRTMPVTISESAGLDPLASIVVDPHLLAQTTASGAERLPLLERYQKQYSSDRSALALTWLNASRLVKEWPARDSTPSIISSDMVTGSVAANRKDAWGNSYCLFVIQKQVVAFSSWNRGALNCPSLAQEARRWAASANSAVLKAGPNGTLVTVQPRALQEARTN